MFNVIRNIRDASDYGLWSPNCIIRVNRLSALVAAAVMMLSAVSCDSEAKRERQAAQDLVNEAQSLMSCKQYDEAFIIMDSVDAAYPQQLEARRQVSKMRQQAMAEYAELQIYQCDSIIAALQGHVDEQSAQFRHIPGGDIPGYYVLSSVYSPDFMARTGIEARIDDNTYRYYIVALNTGEAVGINRIIADAGGAIMESGMIPDGSDRAGETGHGAFDLATFELGEVSALVQWLIDQNTDVNVTLVGRSGQTALMLTPVQAQAIGKTWQFADKASKLYRARIDREKYERQLIIARDHAVNLDD